MENELTNILKTFYEKLHNSIIREEIKLRNDSVLWTLLEVKAKKTEKYLSNSSYSTAHFPKEQLHMLLERNLIESYISMSKNEKYIITAKGIWEIEKQQKSFSEKTLLLFIQEKYFTFNIKHKPMDDKDRLALFSLICIRNFEVNIPMDLNTSKYRDGWVRIFEEVYNFLRINGFLKAKQESFDKLILTRGSEHPIQSIMRHRNDLPIKSRHIFCNPGNSKYYLDLMNVGELNIDWLKHTLKLVFPKIQELSTAKIIGDFCVEIANDYSKYVINDYRFIDSTHDDIIRQVIKETYVG